MHNIRDSYICWDGAAGPDTGGTRITVNGVFLQPREGGHELFCKVGDTVFRAQVGGVRDRVAGKERASDSEPEGKSVAYSMCVLERVGCARRG